jgi:hypothetical protein
MSEQRAKWLAGVPKRRNGALTVDIFEYTAEQPNPSRLVAEMTPEDAAQVIADRERVETVCEALEPIMAYLSEVLRLADPDGQKMGDKIAGVNDTMLRASDIRRLQAALARPAATGDGAQEALARAEGE